jgi:PIN domain nuclease of toxin-antitoxin system
MLVNRGRLALSLDVERWLALLAAHPAVRFLVAQARALAIPLVSADSKIRSYAQG